MTLIRHVFFFYTQILMYKYKLMRLLGVFQQAGGIMRSRTSSTSEAINSANLLPTTPIVYCMASTISCANH